VATRGVYYISCILPDQLIPAPEAVKENLECLGLSYIWWGNYKTGHGGGLPYPAAAYLILSALSST